MSKRLLIGVLKYGIGISLLAFVIWRNWEPSGDPPRGGLQPLWQAHVIEGQPINGGPLTLAAVIFSAAVLPTFVRWYGLIRAQGFSFSVADAVRLGLVGFFFNTFMPGSVGGDLIKATFIAREQKRRTVAVATVIIDRAIAVWALVGFVALSGGAFWSLGLLAGRAERVIVLTAVGISAGSLIVWILLGFLPAWRAQRFAGRLERLPKIGGSAAEFWRAIWMYRCRPRSVGLAILLSLIGHVGFVLTFYFAARTLYEPDQIPSLTTHFLIVPIGMLIQAIPGAPGGGGIGEAGFGGLYDLVGYSPDAGVAGSLVQRVITWVLGFGGYLVYLRMRPALKQTNVAPADDQDSGPEPVAAPEAQLTRE